MHHILLRRMKSGNQGEEKETKGKKDFLHLSHIIMEYNISIRMGMTLK